MKYLCLVTPIFLFSSLLLANNVVSQVAGQAGDHVVTSREVQINYFVETVLFPDEKIKQSPLLDINDKRFEKESTRVLIEWVVGQEADIFNTSAVPAEDVSKSIVLVKQAAQDPAYASYWSRISPSAEELKSMLSRKLRAKKFIQFKTRASIVPVTEAEALQYYQKNRTRFGSAPFAQFKESIKSFLAQEQANKRIREWFELLQRKYRVRKVASYGAASESKR